MKNALSISIFICLFTAAAFAQSDLPEVGKVSDIQGKTRIYLSSDAINVKVIRKELEKRKDLVIVDKPEEADFFIEYQSIKIDYITEFRIPVETGQLDVYFYREKKKVIAWSEGERKSKSPNVSLLKNFLKAFDQK